MDVPEPKPTTEMTDEEVALLVQAGDKEKFGLLMERFEAKLARYGSRFLSRKDNIDDIVQDVFISTYQNINSFDPSLKFSSWIYRIAHNAFVNGLKKQQRGPSLSMDFDLLVAHHAYEDPILKEKEHEEMKAMIDQGLSELKPKYREAIILHYLEDLSYKEISDILEIPTGTVGIRIMRGREALKKACEKLNLRLHYE